MLQKKLDEFSVKLSIGIISICIIVLFMDVFIAKEQLLDALMIAVALAVAAIPEALGSIVTIVLSISTQKMAKENAIIKNLNAVESLGCVSVICSDKTGTLTQNKMTAVDIYTNRMLIQANRLNHHEYCHNILLKAFVLCNNATISKAQSLVIQQRLPYWNYIKIIIIKTHIDCRLNVNRNCRLIPPES